MCLHLELAQMNFLNESFVFSVNGLLTSVYYVYDFETYPCFIVL